MARAAGVEWKAVGASLDTLAATMRTAAHKAPEAFAYANSGVLQQAGVVLAARYIVDGNHAKDDKSGRSIYTAPPGATHGPVVSTIRDNSGNIMRNDRGQWQRKFVERKLFVKGKFVDRSGGMANAADDLARAAPTTRMGVQIVDGETGQRGKRGQVAVGIDRDGNGYVTLSDGYAAAERGTRKRVSSPVRGWWRSLRSVQGRWSTMLRKRYPDLLKLPQVRTR